MKLKTRKTISKRFKIKKSGKVIMRTCGQDHFNSRESSQVTRAKRRDHDISKAVWKTIKSAI